MYPVPLAQCRNEIRFNVSPRTHAIFTTDDVFDGNTHLGEVKDRGIWVSVMACFWREVLTDATHMVQAILPPYMRDKEQIVTIDAAVGVGEVEWAVFSHLVGPLWAEYQQQSTICGERPKEQIHQYQQLPELLVVPSMAGPHGYDVAVSYETAASTLGLEVADLHSTLCCEAYVKAAEVARQRGVIIMGNEFGVGMNCQGSHVLCGKVFTPDLAWMQLADPVEPPAVSVVEQDRLGEWAAKYRLPDGTFPPLPGELVSTLRASLAEMCRRLTGTSLV